MLILVVRSCLDSLSGSEVLLSSSLWQRLQSLFLSSCLVIFLISKHLEHRNQKRVLNLLLLIRLPWLLAS